MIDESFFLTVAGIAMSFAGFAGLMNTLRRRGDAWAPMELYQLRIIVAYAITTLSDRSRQSRSLSCSGSARESSRWAW